MGVGRKTIKRKKNKLTEMIKNRNKDRCRKENDKKK